MKYVMTLVTALALLSSATAAPRTAPASCCKGGACCKAQAGCCKK